MRVKPFSEFVGRQTARGIVPDYPGLQIDLMVEQRILFERQLKAERGTAAMAAGFQSLGRGLDSYSTPARTIKTIPTYQEEEQSGDDPPIVGVGMGLCSGPGLDLGLGVTRGGTQPEC